MEDYNSPIIKPIGDDGDISPESVCTWVAVVIAFAYGGVAWAWAAAAALYSVAAAWTTYVGEQGLC